MFVGSYKYTVHVFEDLIGFRDPNLVPIKDFYEPSTKVITNSFCKITNLYF